MVDRGDSNSFGRGANASITIGTDKYILKRAITLTDDTVIYEDSTPSGILRHPGQPNIHGDAEIYLTESEISIIFGYASQTANGRTTSYPIKYQITAIDDGSTTISGTATISNPQILDTDPELKLLARFRLNFNGALSFA